MDALSGPLYLQLGRNSGRENPLIGGFGTRACMPRILNRRRVSTQARTSFPFGQSLIPSRIELLPAGDPLRLDRRFGFRAEHQAARDAGSLSGSGQR